MNSHTCESALPPAKIAGPRLRAGLTEVPVSGMPTRWITPRVKPIASPAKPLAAIRWVTASTTNTSTNVSSTSTRKAPPMEMPPWEGAPQPLLPSLPWVWSPGTVLAIQNTSAAPAIAPRNWATQ